MTTIDRLRTIRDLLDEALPRLRPRTKAYKAVARAVLHAEIGLHELGQQAELAAWREKLGGL